MADKRTTRGGVAEVLIQDENINRLDYISDIDEWYFMNQSNEEVRITHNQAMRIIWQAILDNECFPNGLSENDFLGVVFFVRIYCDTWNGELRKARNDKGGKQ